MSHQRAPQPMVLSAPLDFEEARTALRAALQNIRDAEDTLTERIEAKASSERIYRKTLAQRFTFHRSEGKGSGEAEVLAKGDAADAGFDLALADGLVKAALEALENRRGDRASLHRLTEWSRALDPFTQREQAAA